MRLIEGEVFDLDTRERAFAVAAGIDADATAVDVNPEAARAAIFGQVMRRRVAEETELAVVSSEEVEIARPQQHVRVGVRGRFARYQAGVNVDGLRVFVKVRQATQELDVRFGDVNVGDVLQLVKVE